LRSGVLQRWAPGRARQRAAGRRRRRQHHAARRCPGSRRRLPGGPRHRPADRPNLFGSPADKTARCCASRPRPVTTAATWSLMSRPRITRRKAFPAVQRPAQRCTIPERHSRAIRPRDVTTPILSAVRPRERDTEQAGTPHGQLPTRDLNSSTPHGRMADSWPPITGYATV